MCFGRKSHPNSYFGSGKIRKQEASRIITRYFNLSNWAVRSALYRDGEIWGRSGLGGRNEEFLDHMKFDLLDIHMKMLSRKLDMHSLGLRGEVGWGLIHSHAAGSNGTRTQVSWFQNYLLLAFLFSQGKCKHLAL